MNLFDMAHRRDSNLVLHGTLAPAGWRGRALRLLRSFVTIRSPFIGLAKRSFGGRDYRGLEMSGGAAVTLVRPFRWNQLRSNPRSSGWYAGVLGNKSTSAVLEVSLVRKGEPRPVAVERIPLQSSLSVVPIPGVEVTPDQLLELDVNVRLQASRGSRAFLAVHEILDRAPLLQLCKGAGIEIGPGLNPQVRPSSRVDVMYVEQATPEQWETLYNEKGNLKIDRALWKRYIRGDAFPLPIADDSADFIFSSHVFEHLANPIEHLAHWRAKLRSGGLIAAVVPDCTGCKDYVFEPTSMAEIEKEYAVGVMQPELHHFERWAEVRAKGQDPARFMDQGRSIHVHFYTRSNMERLLQFACQKLGFERYELRHVPNHKDFHFVLWK